MPYTLYMAVIYMAYKYIFINGIYSFSLSTHSLNLFVHMVMIFAIGDERSIMYKSKREIFNIFAHQFKRISAL